MQVEIDPSGNRQFALPASKVLACLVNCGQRRGAHRVDRDAGSLKIQHVRNAVGDGTEGCAREERFTTAPEVRPIQCESSLRGARKNSDAVLVNRCETFASVARVFQQFPAGLQEQALLRVHASRLSWRDIEEQRVELQMALDKAAPLAVALALGDRFFNVSVVEGIKGPAFRR